MTSPTAIIDAEQRQRDLLQQRATVLSEVLELGHRLRPNRPLAETLTDVAHGIVKSVGYRSVIINLRSERAPNVFEPVAFAGIAPETAARLRDEPIPARLVNALCDERWHISSSYYVPGAAVHRLFGADLERLTTITVLDQRHGADWHPDDMFVTPLRHPSGEIYGFISVDDPLDRQRPDRNIAEAVEIFANQAMIAMDNVRLYAEAQRRLTAQNALNRIQRAINASLSTRHILQEIHAGLHDTLAMDSYGSVMLYPDRDDVALEIRRDGDGWHEAERRLADGGLHAYMMQTREALLFDDLRSEAATLPPEAQPLQLDDAGRCPASWLGAPLIASDDRVIGALSVHADAPDRWSRHELDFIQAVANQVALCLDNARMFADRERRLHEMNVVNQLAQALTAPLGVDELAEVLLLQLGTALFTDSLWLAVYDRQSELIEFPLYLERGLRRNPEPRRGGNGLTEYMLRTRRSLLLNDDVAPQIEALGVDVIGAVPQSFAGAPLLVGTEAVGAVAVQHFETNHAFGSHELRLLEAIAHQIASGIEKARLLQDRERQIAQTEALNTIGKVTSSTLELDQIFVGMYTELRRYRHADALLLVICDRDRSMITRSLVFDRGELFIDQTPEQIVPDSFTDVIMRTGKPILLRNAPVEREQYGVRPQLAGTATTSISWAGVPLMATNGQPFGLLSMQGYTVGEFDLRDIDFLTNVANQIALNIQNAALFKQSQEQVRQLAAETERLELINRVSAWTGELPDAQELLQRMVTEMARMTRADQARLMMFDRARGLGLCQAEYRDTGATGQLTIPLADNPSVRWMDEHQTAMLVPNVADDPRFAPIHELMRAEQIRDMLIVPLVVKGDVIGSIGLDTKAREHSFSERDIATCITIANQVATALENARLWKATQQSVLELTMLYELSVSLTTMLDLDEILATLAGAALEIERADVSGIVLLDQHGQISRFAGLARSGQALSSALFADPGLLQTTIRAARPLLVRDAAAERWFGTAAAMRSGVIVPIMIKSEPVGALVIAASEPRDWSEREQSLLSIMTGQAASAIENASLFQSEQEKRQLADTLREVALSLTSTLDLREVLEIILVQLRRVVPYDSTSVQLLREDNHLQIISVRGLDAALVEELIFPADSSLHPNERVASTRQPHIVGDVKQDFPAFQVSPYTQHIRSWMGVPLLYGNQLLGMITLDSRQPHFYTADMADVALMFATQAAQAIAHARLFDQIRQFNAELEQMVAERTAALTAEKDRLEAVHAITTTLTGSLDIGEIAVRTLELAANALGATRGSLLIRDAEREELVYRAVLSEHEGLLATMQPFRLPPGNVVEWTLEHQQGVLIDDVRLDSRWISAGSYTDSIRSFLVVPLLAADVPLGVLMFSSREIAFFNEEHLRLLSTIGSEVAIAVHNAELYNFINEQATRLAELLQIQREETGKNRAILESVAEGVFVLDESGTVVLCNRAASDVLRIGDDEIVGRGLQHLLEQSHNIEEQQRAASLYDALSKGVAGARERNDLLNRLLELPGQTIDLTFTPVTTPDGERIGVAAVLRDITREIEAEKAKREFVATVSHELRTPLTSVKGYVDLLILGTAGPITEMQHSFLKVVKSNADRLNGLVEDILEISRLENGKVTLNVKPIDLGELVTDILASLRTETERKRLQVAVEIEPGLPTIKADSKRIGQVLINLLSNAHKYTRDGGAVTLRAACRGAFVQVDVRDTGVGIPPEDLGKMFGRFFRSNNALKDEVGGTGLGLSIAKSFVELHGGEMWVTSEVNVGSTFSFTLPLAPPDASQCPSTALLVSEVAHAS